MFTTMNIANVRPLPSTYYYHIKANQERLAKNPLFLSPLRNLKQREDKRQYDISLNYRLGSFYLVRFIDKYVNPKVIDNAIKTNPNIKKILKNNGLPVKISEKNIDNNAKAHMFATYLYAKDIAKAVNLSENNSLILYQAALLHDIGKALIPEEIVQKPGKLTNDERKIIDLHSQLGYEIIKTTKIPVEVAELIKKHHYNKDAVKENDICCLILSVADVFSALKEKRAYKPAMQDKEAIDIMYGMPKLSSVFVHILRGNTENRV